MLKVSTDVQPAGCTQGARMLMICPPIISACHSRPFQGPDVKVALVHDAELQTLELIWNLPMSASQYCPVLARASPTPRPLV